MQTFLVIIASGIVIYWLHFFWMAYKLQVLLNHFKTHEKNLSTPFVSIVIPARNEGDHIEASLLGFSQQTYKNFEIIMVNDRSNDQTGSIMQKYVSTNWHYIQIDSLPERWLGKNHALNQGAKKATGEYCIFTDGDVVFQPNAIEVAMQCVQAHQLDHLVLSTKLKGEGLLLNAMQSLFALGMISMLKLHKLGKSPKYYMGAGVFNLVKTSLYRSLGGHESIRLEVLDDIMIGKIMVQAGAKPGFMDGRDLLTVEWYPTWKTMIRGLEKNSFASLRYSFPRLIVLLISVYGIYLFPYIGIFLGSASCWIFAIALLFSHTTLAVASKRMGHSAWCTFFLPVAIFLVGFTFLRSAILTTLRGKITWRDTSYPLQLLKETTKL